MRRVNYTPYLVLIGFLFSVMSLSPDSANKLRGTSMKIIAPFWDGIHFSKVWLASALHLNISDSLELQQLRLENEMLTSQIEKVREWLLFEERIDEQWERLKALGQHNEGELFWKEFFRRRSEQLAELIDLQLQSLPARVVFREPASWSSSFWVNVGEKDNEMLGTLIVSKNSPVVIGTSLVGVVEYVGRKQSRVRLITDSSLVPAVRVSRNGEQNRFVLEHLDIVLKNVEMREDLFSEEIFAALESLKQTLSQDVTERLLAKGEIYGSSSQLMRSHSQTLKGVGFNYDFADEEGTARDLRTGNILREGDLLVTSGLDGVFPPGLRVGFVVKVDQLREGATSYELEAKAAAGNLHELTHVLVLPALGTRIHEG
ncbi:MAG: rod shape-determining protein MreC [Chlamydiota bacterium]